MNELIEKDITCPYCAETISVVIETLDESQEYIEDCQVCCRPITVAVEIDEEGIPSVTTQDENQA